MDLRAYLGVLRRRWIVVVACLVAGIAVSVLFLLRATPQYASTARLFVSTPGSDAANAQAYQGGLFSQQRVTSYADLIKGSTVAERVLQQVGSNESPASLVGQITAKVAPDTVILQVTVTDPDPARAQLLAQTTAEVFTEYVGELESANDPSRAVIKANIVDAANLPTSPVSPRPLITIGLGTLIGLLVGLAAAWLRETLDTTIKTPEGLAELAGAGSLGAVFYDPDAVKRPLIADLDTHAPRVEAFRILRTNLQFLNVDNASAIFTVTSPLPGDGKSTTAVNLAIALAQAGRRTLLLEADLRRPRVGEYLDLESAVGLTTVLIGQAELADVVQPWGKDGLHVVTSGPLPPNPAELLQSNAMTGLLKQLLNQYDVVIIDAPPVLPVTDSALLAAASDGAILVARHGETTRDQVVQSRQRLESVDASLLGTVLNFAPAKGAGSYGYSYGYSPKQPVSMTPAAATPPPTEPTSAATEATTGGAAVAVDDDAKPEADWWQTDEAAEPKHSRHSADEAPAPEAAETADAARSNGAAGSFFTR